MKAIELIELIKDYQTRTGHRPHGVTIHAADVHGVQMDLVDDSIAMTEVESADMAGRIPRGEDGETYTMTFLGVPIFMRTDGVEIGQPRLWVTR